MTTVNRLSMWTSYFCDVGPEEALEELAAAGWGFAELSEEHGGVRPWTGLTDWVDSARRALGN
jgi:hypothetical protein